MLDRAGLRRRTALSRTRPAATRGVWRQTGLLLAGLLVPGAAAAEAGARLSSVLRVGTVGCTGSGAMGCPLRDFQDAAVVAPWIEGGESGRWSARAAVDFRIHGPTALSALEQGANPRELQPYSLRFRDAWIASYSKHLDTRIGVARIAWGVGQGVSVVDALHAWDLSNPTRLDQRLNTFRGILSNTDSSTHAKSLI